MADSTLDEPDTAEETLPLPLLFGEDLGPLPRREKAEAETKPIPVATDNRLRADLLTPVVEISPGEPATVVVQVLNTSSVIETIDVRIFEVMPESVEITPSEVTLFPGESTQITLELLFHRTLPAGEHQAIIEVSSATRLLPPAELALLIVVPQTAGVDVVAEPPLRIGGRKALYDVTIGNAGNTPLRLRVKATDADRKLALYLNYPGSLQLPVGDTIDATLVARRRRPWTGAPVEHVITVDVEGESIAETAEVRFRQKAILTPGVITILVLATIVVLWAIAMLFGVQSALAPAPATKTLPESFVAGVGIGDLDAAAVGGTVAGTVTAASTAQPLARVTIEAFDSRGELVGATATGDDGSYELGGLLPVRHRLRIRAAGFEEQWWPGAAGAADAVPLMVPPTVVTGEIDAQLVGLPGTLGGQALAGDGEPHEITVEVVALDLLEEMATVTTVADADGVWSVSGLAAPANYRVTYRAAGYAPVEVTQPLDGGAQIVLNTTRLPAGLGAVAGITIDREGLPIGGVEVTAQRGDFARTVVTPTSGEVGTFALDELETPGTYLLTFAAEGYAQETRAIRLGPGESLGELEIVLTPALGVVFGRARTSDGRDLGGVRVTVSGGGIVLTTDTFTSGSVGTFRLSGLPLPGIYAVTFDLEGFTRQTVQVQLHNESSQAFAEVTMTASIGRLMGQVLDDATGQPLGAVAIEVSDGSTVRTTTTASAPASQVGRFNIGDLAPGTYTVTARVPGGGTHTVLQVIEAAGTHELILRVQGPP